MKVAPWQLRRLVYLREVKRPAESDWRTIAKLQSLVKHDSKQVRAVASAARVDWKMIEKLAALANTSTKATGSGNEKEKA